MYLRDTTLDEQARRIFQEALYLVEEARADDAVDDPVIARDRHHHRLTYGELAVAYDRAILDGADGENRRLRRHDEPVLDRNRHPNVNIRIDNDAVVLKARVHPRVTA